MSLMSLVCDGVGYVVDSGIQWKLFREIQKKTKAIKDMNNLEIDRNQKTASMKLDLVGESDLLSVKIGSYRLVEENGKTMIELANIQTSKEWLNILVAEHFKIPRFEVPAIVRMIL